jgi:hypothetical protein
MFFIHLVSAFIIALILTAIFVAGFRQRGPWESFLVFFSVIFLASWAGGIWLSPIGPPLWGAYWLGFLIVGLIFALLLAASVSPGPRRSTVEFVKPDEREADIKKAVRVLGVFFWLLVVALTLAIVTRYF